MQPHAPTRQFSPSQANQSPSNNTSQKSRQTSPVQSNAVQSGQKFKIRTTNRQTSSLQGRIPTKTHQPCPAPCSQSRCNNASYCRCWTGATRPDQKEELVVPTQSTAKPRPRERSQARTRESGLLVCACVRVCVCVCIGQ